MQLHGSTVMTVDATLSQDSSLAARVFGAKFETFDLSTKVRSVSSREISHDVLNVASCGRRSFVVVTGHGISWYTDGHMTATRELDIEQAATTSRGHVWCLSQGQLFDVHDESVHPSGLHVGEVLSIHYQERARAVVIVGLDGHVERIRLNIGRQETLDGSREPPTTTAYCDVFGALWTADSSGISCLRIDPSPRRKRYTLNFSGEGIVVSDNGEWLLLRDQPPVWNLWHVPTRSHFQIPPINPTSTIHFNHRTQLVVIDWETSDILTHVLPARLERRPIENIFESNQYWLATIRPPTTRE